MSSSKSSTTESEIPAFLKGDSEMAKRIREFDWSQTSLGAVEHWPRSLRTCVQIMLTSRQPIWIGWGKELIKLYNDPYKAIVMGKHPHALGQPASVVWRDIWKDIEPMLNKVMYENEGTYVEEQLLIMHRNGYPEETYYTFSYTPVAGDSGSTEGMICFNTDDTERIVSERQLTTLTKLAHAFSEVRTKEELFENAMTVLGQNQYDFPFGLLYECSQNEATLVGSTPLGDAAKHIQNIIDLGDASELPGLCAKAIQQRKIQVLNDVVTRMGEMPRGVWEICPHTLIVIPVVNKSQASAGTLLLLIGLNPYRIPDEKYLAFFDLVADQMMTTLTNVFGIQEERKRLAAMAEIDRAKTTFFSNISHEFRTPLTLLLGPIEDLLRDESWSGGSRERLEVAYRNALRMQRLVNTLLDFSRIEARRMEPMFVPVDIAALTEDLASSFRSAIEKAGMQLLIRAEKIEEPVFVDVDMWEKIILNLLSNAFKYTERGTITVAVSKQDGLIVVTVADTGTGIPEGDIHRIFDRFHRVQNEKGRSQEGTGIGLAMVKELVKLQGGFIFVESTEGKGSTFRVSIPMQPAGVRFLGHMKEVRSREAVSRAYVQEALQWIPQSTAQVLPQKKNGLEATHRFKVLLADDNADMRTYIERLLQDDYDVISAVDGEDAFEKATSQRPDLILSDIMMPKLDGFGLLKKLKGTLATNTIPIIFLSARAGEEAKVEGLNAGADDYLTKPFSSRELLARVSNQIAISHARRKTEKEFFNLFYQAPAHIHVMRGPDHIFEFYHPNAKRFSGGRDLTGLKVREALPEIEGQGFFELLDRVYNDGDTVHLPEARALFSNEHGEAEEYFFNTTYLPWKDLHGKIQGVLQFTFEVTETVRNRLKAENSERKFRSIAQQAPVAMAVLRGPDHIVDVANAKVLELWGKTFEEVVDKPVLEVFPELESQGFRHLLGKVYETGEPMIADELPIVFERQGKSKKVYVNLLYHPLRDEHHRIEGIVAVGTDVTVQVEARRIIEEAEYKLKNAVALAELGTWHFNLKTNLVEYTSKVATLWGLPEEGTTLSEVISVIHPDDREQVATLVNDAIHSNGQYQAEYRIINKVTGALHYMVAGGKVFMDQDQNPDMLSGVVRDVTMERTMQQELEKLVEIRTRQLVEVNNDLMRSNENLRQFAYVASHDLQEPLRKILTYSDMVSVRNQDSNIIGKEYLSKIATGARRMSHLIKDLLEFSQTERKDELFEMVDLGKVLQSIKTDYEMIISEKNALIFIDEMRVVPAIPLQMNQLFYNLIGNALKFSRTDVQPVVKVFAETADPAVIQAMGLHPELEYCLLKVQDNGIGFDQKYADQIFVLFQRLHVRDQYEGTGIGLALCKKIVENHKGLITVESAVGLGSTFKIFLPTQRL